jgi:syntaxin 18
MIGPVDRTAELAALLGSSSSRSAGCPALNTKPIAATHAYTVQTSELSARIAAMRATVSAQRRRYSDYGPRGLSDAARDTLDSSIAVFLRACVGQIDALKAEAVEDLERRRGAASFPAHRLGGVAILNEQLQGVGRLAEELRSVRIRAAIKERATAAPVRYSKEAAKGAAAAARERERAQGGGGPEDTAEVIEFAQEFAQENATLVGELVETRERVREAERTVVEIANLNHVFATKVLEQAREIETLYDLAVEATMYVDRGNKELRKMKGKGPMLKYYVAFAVLVLTFAMLFLDWFAQRRSLLSLLPL